MQEINIPFDDQGIPAVFLVAFSYERKIPLLTMMIS